MKFTSTAQKKAYAAAMKQKYKAVAFDVDGTLTEFGRFIIPNYLAFTLEGLPEELPFAICTGRELKYIRGELSHLVHKKNRYIFCENGAIGYKYDAKKEDFNLIHEVKWPNNRITPAALEAFMKDRFGWKISVVVREHSVVEIYAKWLYIFPKIVKRVSANAGHSLQKLLKDMELDDVLKSQNSGIGNIVMPKAGGKGTAMLAWAKHLRIKPHEILVIGDQPEVGGNDEEFLSGENGTAFTVGQQTKNVYPLPVIDSRGRKLWGPRGTEWLLKNLKLGK